MGLKCTNINGLRSILNNACQETKPNGQIKHTIGENCIVNTYDTGSVVIQDNTKDKSKEKEVIALIDAINKMDLSNCKNKKND